MTHQHFQSQYEIYKQKEMLHPEYSLETTAEYIYAILGMDMPLATKTEEVRIANTFNEVQAVTNTIELRDGHISIKRNTSQDQRVEEISFTQYAYDSQYSFHSNRYMDFTETLELMPRLADYNRYSFKVKIGSGRHAEVKHHAGVHDKDGLNEWFFDNKGMAVGSKEYVVMKLATMSSEISDKAIPEEINRFMHDQNRFAVQPLLVNA